MGSRIINGGYRLPVTYPGEKSDGTYGHYSVFWPEADIASDSFYKRNKQLFLGNAKLDWSPIKYLTLTTKVGYRRNYYNYTDYHATFVVDKNLTAEPNMLTITNTINQELVTDFLAQYERSVDNHKIFLLVGFDQDEYRTETITAYRDNFPNNSLYVLNAGSSSNEQNTGTASEWALQSYFGRLNYDYSGKYLLAASFRYDGSSRFAEENRWGFFPSVSAGWRISEEDFFSNNFSFFDNLKLRASWGILGNQEIGNYSYQDTYTLGQDYPFGVTPTMSSGAAVTTLANHDITWETTEGVDVGLDASLFNEKLNFVVDFFSKLTSGILYEVSSSTCLGLNTSEENAGEVSNKGFDLKINYRNSIKDFSYGATLTFSAVKNEVKKLSNVDYDISNGLFVGEPLESVYGYVDDGLFVDSEDVDSYADQPMTPKPGYIRYKDISGPDGVPDGVTNSTYDRKVIGSRFPKYAYGLNLNAAYKNFDIQAQFQGTGGMYRDLKSSQTTCAYQNMATPQRWMVDNRWTTENPDRYAKYPMFSTGLMNNASCHLTSTYWMMEASYLRLKNLQIGYNVPSKVLRNVKINKLRFYVSGTNLFTLDNFYEGWDAEPLNPGSNTFYPITSVFTFGVNASF